MAFKNAKYKTVSITRTAIFNNVLSAHMPGGTLISTWVSTRLAQDGSYVEAVFNSVSSVVNQNINDIITTNCWVSKDQVISLMGATATGYTENDLINVADNINGTHIDFTFNIKLTS